MGGFIECEKNMFEILVGTGKFRFSVESIFEWIIVQITKFDDWNTLFFIILLFFIVIQAKNYNKNKTLNKNLNIFCGIFFILTICFSINFKKNCTVDILQREWGFSYTLGVFKYDQKLKENDEIDGIKILKIEEDGVLVEYEKTIYETKESKDFGDLKTGLKISPEMFKYETKKEIVTQKLLWNTIYKKDDTRPPDLCVDGGTEYYYKFEK